MTDSRLQVTSYRGQGTEKREHKPITYRLSSCHLVSDYPHRLSLLVPRLPGVRTDQRDETHPAEALGTNLAAMPRQAQQQLLVAPADRDDQPAPVGELLAQRARRPRRRRRADDRVERGVLRQARGSIAHEDVH